jgi:hypothetical protein
MPDADAFFLGASNLMQDVFRDTPRSAPLLQVIERGIADMDASALSYRCEF